MTRVAQSVLVALGLSLCVAKGGAGQEPEVVTVRVRQVAGPNVYFDLGTQNGIATGDTLAVAREGAGPVVGHLFVTASTETRSVMSFAGALFPVTRGEVLTLYLHRAPPEETPGAAVPVRRPSAREPAAPVKERLPMRGRVALDFSGNHSTTRFGGADPVDIERTYATPALRVDATIPQAVSGFDLRTSFRMAYRYSDPSGMTPAASTRVYTAALERRKRGLLQSGVIEIRVFYRLEADSKASPCSCP